MKLPPGSEANQRTTPAHTVDAEQRTRSSSSSRSRNNSSKNAIYLLIYPRSIKYVKSTKQRGTSGQPDRLARCLRLRPGRVQQELGQLSMATCAASVFKLLVSRFV